MTPLLALLRRALFLPEQASSVAPGVDILHVAVLASALLGSLGVALITLQHVVRYRRRREDEKTPRIESGRLKLALKIGAPLVLFLVFWVFGFRQYLRIETPPPGAMDVYVTGKQWMWKFTYPSGPSTISTLVVPKGRPVRLLMTSRDVIHSFYVPAFRVKQDVVPGRTTALWFEATKTGEFEILCAEYCGISHSGMRGAVRVLEEPDFQRWLEEESHAGTMAARGAKLAKEKQCLACHSPDGETRTGPTFLGLYRSTVPLADGRRIVADEGYLTQSMLLPAADTRAGFSSVMPSYAGQLSFDETSALVEYIKSLGAPR